MIVINVAKDFSDTPGGRYRKDGKFSGEEFREDFLIPKYLEAKEKNERLLINIDNCYGFCDSFLDEAFCEFTRQIYPENFFDVIDFETSDGGLKHDVLHTVMECSVECSLKDTERQVLPDEIYGE